MVLGGVPQLTRDRIQAQSRYNGLAAAFAGVTAICQAIFNGLFKLRHDATGEVDEFSASCRDDMRFSLAWMARPCAFPRRCAHRQKR